MRELVGVAIAMGLLAACGSGGTKQNTVPENSAAVDCTSTAAVITRVLAAEHKQPEPAAVKTDVAKRCTDDKWTAEARTCLLGANTGQALHDCGYKTLTQEQQDKLDKTTAVLTSLNVERVLDEMAKFKDQLCACKDAPCAQKVSDDMTKWSVELTQKEKDPPQLSEAQQKRAAGLGTEMGNCMQTAMGGAAGGGAGGGGPAAPLSVTGIDPPRGDVGGGTYVKLTGTSFVSEGARNVKVYFGSKQGTVIRFASDTELIVEAPGGKPNETVDVLLVFDPGGEIKLPKAFTFEKPKKKKK
jgi:hypothetical protein